MKDLEERAGVAQEGRRSDKTEINACKDLDLGQRGDLENGKRPSISSKQLKEGQLSRVSGIVS